MNQDLLQRELDSISWGKLDQIIQNDSEQSIKKYQKLINEMPHWIWETNNQKRIVYSNFYVSKIIGYEVAEVIGLTIADILFPCEFNGIDIDLLLKKFIYDNEHQITLKHRIRHQDQSIRFLKTVVMANRNNNGKLVGFQGITHDQTCQVIAEEALKKSEKNFRLVLTNLSEVVFMVNSEGVITFISPAVEKLFKILPGEILGKHVIEIKKSLHSDDSSIILNKFKKAVKLKLDEFSCESKIIIKKRRRIFDLSVNILYDPNGNFEGVTGVIRDITKKRRSEADISAAFDGAIEAIAAIVEQRDIYTHGHQHNVADLSVAIAEKLGLKSDRIKGLRIAAVLHDVGKVSIPTEILNRPSELSNTERKIIEMHPKLGSTILRSIPFPWNIARFVEEHHERIDGSGYPKALKGEEISLEAKIIGVADTLDSITNHRPFRSAKDIREAIGIIKNDRGIKFDTNVVDAVLALYKEGAFNSTNSDCEQTFL